MAHRLSMTCGLLVSMCLPSTLFGQTAHYRDESASDLVEQFKSETVFWKQIDLAKKIVALGDKRVLRDLEPLLGNEDRHLRGNAAFVFAGLGDDRGFEVINRILNDRSVRPPGQGASMIEGSEEDLRNPPPQLQIAADRYYAAHLFGDLKDARAVPILVPLLKDKEVNSVVPWSLAQIGDKSAIPPLIETLDDESPDMRVLAIYALEQLDAKEALPKIRALLHDHETIHFDGLGPVSDAASKGVIKLEQKP